MLKPYVGFLLIAVACLAGCGKAKKPLPPTYPVHGHVTYKDGTPVRDGFVLFQSEADPWVTTTGAIQSDGTYRLTTMRDGLRAEGAVAGRNRIIVTSVQSGNANATAGKTEMVQQGAPPTIYPTPYNVEPRDNEFPLTVGQPPFQRP